MNKNQPGMSTKLLFWYLANKHMFCSVSSRSPPLSSTTLGVKDMFEVTPSLGGFHGEKPGNAIHEQKLSSTQEEKLSLFGDKDYKTQSLFDSKDSESSVHTQQKSEDKPSWLSNGSSKDKKESAGAMSSLSGLPSLSK